LLLGVGVKKGKAVFFYVIVCIDLFCHYCFHLLSSFYLSSPLVSPSVKVLFVRVSYPFCVKNLIGNVFLSCCVDETKWKDLIPGKHLANHQDQESSSPSFSFIRLKFPSKIYGTAGVLPSAAGLT
jgi:hypothetical protein